MDISQYITQNSPITNLPDLLNLHHNNPLGISPIIQLIFIFVVVEVMNIFDYQIRNKDKQQYYPVLYILLGVSLAAVYYYCFQSGLKEVLVEGLQLKKPCIGWFCQHEVVGWGWAVVGIVMLTHVIYCLLCAVMQVSAQLSVEAKMIEGKKWKEWKWALAILLLGVTVTGISYVNIRTFISPEFSSWSFIIMVAALTLFSLFKIIADSIRCHNFLWGLLIGVTTFIGLIATMMLTLECLRGLLFFIVVLVIFFSKAKASKKKTKEAK